MVDVLGDDCDGLGRLGAARGKSSRTSGLAC